MSGIQALYLLRPKFVKVTTHSRLPPRCTGRDLQHRIVLRGYLKGQRCTPRLHILTKHQGRISLSPELASPVKSGEPFMTMPMREPVSSSRIFEIMCWRKSNWPSDMRGRPAPKRPSAPSVCASLPLVSSLAMSSSTMRRMTSRGVKCSPAVSSRFPRTVGSGPRTDSPFRCCRRVRGAGRSA